MRKHKNRLLTFGRICGYGFGSFVRNAWLSVAATLIMTITLLVIFTATVSVHILDNTIVSLKERVDIPIYLKTGTTESQVEPVIDKLKSDKIIISAKFISSDEAWQQMIDANKKDKGMVSAMAEAKNQMPATLNVVVKDMSDTSKLEKFINSEKIIKALIHPDHESPILNGRRDTIESISRAVTFAQIGGIIIASIFVAITSLVIFNTIRMAIFSRKEEIEMMKLIGADPSFIRGPFLIESIIYGLVAAVITLVLGFWGFWLILPVLKSYQIPIEATNGLLFGNFWLVALATMAIGSMIGFISSFSATRHYLKRM